MGKLRLRVPARKNEACSRRVLRPRAYRDRPLFECPGLGSPGAFDVFGSGQSVPNTRSPSTRTFPAFLRGCDLERFLNRLEHVVDDPLPVNRPSPAVCSTWSTASIRSTRERCQSTRTEIETGAGMRVPRAALAVARSLSMVDDGDYDTPELLCWRATGSTDTDPLNVTSRVRLSPIELDIADFETMTAAVQTVRHPGSPE